MKTVLNILKVGILALTPSFLGNSALFLSQTIKQ